MKVKALVFMVFAVAIFALGVLVTTVFNTAPETNEAVALFYVSLFLTLFGGLFFALFFAIYLNTRVSPGRATVEKITRGILPLSFLTVALLALRAHQALSWPTFFVFALASSIGAALLWRRISQ